ncbi:DoxX family protein [Panacibacter ginsenosidivorans]|uniref:DoxX family protein n=1 Tax=Panacibacter ginsenosidivorans TaxID=1813871 RepID=A0A5B8VBE9_9BACT|nr:DoxX family protein [Panacibacter ginsenosidivorans]QEC68672.1 DoxX family protein [Panacibacter ginsenosidivorans]
MITINPENKWRRNISKTFWLYTMVALYVIAGINHFVNTATYLTIMPPWLPWPAELIFVSGAFEIFFGLLLVPLATRSIASLVLILLLIVVFPANIQMMLNYIQENNPYKWLSILRLPLQFVLIGWAYNYYKRPALIRPI